MDSFKMINEIQDRLCDEKSRIIFESRLTYCLDRNMDTLTDALNVTIDEFECPDFEQFMQNRKEVIIFGAGADGRKTFSILKKMKIKVIAFCDSNRRIWNSTIEDITIVSPEKLKTEYQQEAIVIASRVYVDNIYEQLLVSGVQRERIYYPPYREFVARTGQQYFDLKEWRYEEHEIFVDAGSYDAQTAVDFAKWCENSYDKMYLFEPQVNSVEECKRRVKEENLRNTEILPYGTWSRKELLAFDDQGGAGSKICESGNNMLETISIDEAVGKDKVTFIKMDVEGSELESLKGARETILHNAPKLAICVYHKPEDIITIPAYIMKILPEYKFWLRHYSSKEWETVLYASM